jgi:ABC-2 type transport system permease protein
MRPSWHLKYIRITSLIHRYLTFAFRDFGMLAGMFFWPALDIIIWGFNAKWAETTTSLIGYQYFLLTGLLFLQIAPRIYMDLSFNFFEELRSLHVATLFATPLSISEWVLSAMGTGLIKSCIVGSYIMLLCWLLFDVHLLTLHPSFLLFLIPVIVFSWAAGIVTVALFFTYGSAIHSIAYVYKTSLMLFSGLFYPLILLPIGVRIAAFSLPLHYIFSGLKELFTHNTFNVGLFLKGSALAGIYLAIALGIFRWLVGKSKERGLSALDSI